MPRKTSLRTALLGVLCALVAGTAAAAPQPLNPTDAQRYALAFDAAERGDFIEAELKAAEVQDKALAGHVALRRLLHAAYKATFEDLAGWLDRYADLPGADRVHALAESRRPVGAPAPRAPLLAGLDWRKVENAAKGVVPKASADKGRAAREAYYSGDVARALPLAQASGERWIAGLAAYRLKNYALAEAFFDQVARDEGEDAWLRAGAAFWAARAADQIGDPARSRHFLVLAARHPDTFYGMIAGRRVELQARATAQGAPTGDIVPASFAIPSTDLLRFVREEPRAHRAAALAQIGRVTEAGLELRAGLTLARTPVERDRWMELVATLNGPLTTGAELVRTATRLTPNFADFPTPDLEPKWGFTVDKALVYAIVRQESRFNPLAVSPAGAVGLMQLMPEAAARAAGDDKLKADMTPLFDPAFNLRVGQDYFAWLMERGVGYDLLKAVAAYNGGPSTLAKTAERVGEDDSLLIIESLPSLETRAYVEKVMAGYWTYRKMFGQETPTLDALALGAASADARLDFAPAG
ncbi:MAG: transglycosylase SLT domain-containing protein [Phenylobacterium sp.]|uniref:lytic transglycosylase domain-containing protein n=1 Tax=Phenylobacterium sp. TaxID=1871053 RepID=UPI00391CCD4D